MLISQGVHLQWAVKQMQGRGMWKITRQVALRLLHSSLASFFVFR